jgi:MFS family permease
VGLATAGLGGIVFGLIEGERLGWGTTIAASIVAGIVLVALFVGWQHVQRREPLMPLELFTAERSFPLGNAIGFVFQLGMISIALVLVLYLQNVLGYSPLQTALVLLPGAVLTAIGSAYAGRLSDRVGGKGVLAAGLAALALGLAVIVLAVRPDATAWQLMPGLVIIGIASGATFAPLQAVTMAGVEARLAGAAAGVSGTTRQIGGVLGTAALGAILSSTAGSAVRYEAEQRAGVLPAELRTSFVESTVDAARQFSPPVFRKGDAALAERIGYEAFAAGYVSAMQVTLLVAAVALVLAALLCSGLESTPREVRSPARA